MESQSRYSILKDLATELNTEVGELSKLENELITADELYQAELAGFNTRQSEEKSKLLRKYSELSTQLSNQDKNLENEIEKIKDSFEAQKKEATKQLDCKNQVLKELESRQAYELEEFRKRFENNKLRNEFAKKKIQKDIDSSKIKIKGLQDTIESLKQVSKESINVKPQ